MSWKTQSDEHEVSETVDVTVDLFRVPRGKLLQALINQGAIVESEAERLLLREATTTLDPFEVDERFAIDRTQLEEARADLFSGRRSEALIHLERALGGDFVGRLAIA